mgnify:FL=1
MKSNKGFTLIELLAVIVILAIIALIATPMILGVIDTAKQGSAKSSAQYYVEAVEKTIMTNQLDGNGSVADGTYTVGEDGVTLTSGSNSFKVNVKGDKASKDSTVTIANGQVTTATLTFTNIYAKSVTVDANGNATIKNS